MYEKTEKIRLKLKSFFTSPNNLTKLGYTLLIIVTLLLGSSGLFKILGGSFADSFYTTFNLDSFYRIRIGFIELLSVILIWFKRTSVFGFYLILCLMGGAVATHIVTSTPGMNAPIFIGISTFLGISIVKHGLKIKNWF